MLFENTNKTSGGILCLSISKHNEFYGIVCVVFSRIEEGISANIWINYLKILKNSKFSSQSLRRNYNSLTYKNKYVFQAK